MHSEGQSAPSVDPVSSDGDARAFDWYAGDHHIHTMFSRDAMYSVDDQVRRGAECGLDWMVLTDHGGPDHAKQSVALQTPLIAEAREKHPVLVFQGMEWNIPGAEHATVIAPNHERTPELLQAFERRFDGDVVAAVQNPTGPRLIHHSYEAGPVAEQLGLDALAWLVEELRRGTVDEALVLSNHPMRTGRVSPSKVRGWRDAAPGVFVGWEGAPGHQAAALAAPSRARGRGQYDESPGPLSFPGYDRDQYRTWGGFDAGTARMGGVWDSLLAEGLPWWVTANSDNHFDTGDTWRVGSPSREHYWEHGHRGYPVDTGRVQHGYVDFAPGFYSRTVVGADHRDYRSVMAGLRNGRVFVVHGGLVRAVEARVRAGGEGPGVTFGARTTVRRGGDVEVELLVDPATAPNGGGEVPRSARWDVIVGTVTGRVADTDRDLFAAPGTRVVESFEVSPRATGRQRFTTTLRGVADPLYVRFRGSDGRHADADGHPRVDRVGDSDPWDDLWCYTNPVFVDVG